MRDLAFSQGGGGPHAVLQVFRQGGGVQGLEQLAGGEEGGHEGAEILVADGRVAGGAGEGFQKGAGLAERK